MQKLRGLSGEGGGGGVFANLWLGTLLLMALLRATTSQGKSSYFYILLKKINKIKMSAVYALF